MILDLQVLGSRLSSSYYMIYLIFWVSGSRRRKNCGYLDIIISLKSRSLTEVLLKYLDIPYINNYVFEGLLHVINNSCFWLQNYSKPSSPAVTISSSNC